MKEFKRYYEVAENTALVLSFILQELVISSLTEHAILVSPIVGFCFSTVFIVVGYIIFEKILESFLKSQLVRKWILGSKYIEGIWIENICDSSDNTKLISYGIVNIEYDDSLKYSGSNIDISTFESTGDFFAKSILCQWPTMDYSYLFYKNDRNSATEGFGHIQFVSNSKEPIELNGFFIDPMSGHKYLFHSYKITDKRRLKALNCPETRAVTLRKIITERGLDNLGVKNDYEGQKSIF